MAGGIGHGERPGRQGAVLCLSAHSHRPLGDDYERVELIAIRGQDVIETRCLGGERCGAKTQEDHP